MKIVGLIPSRLESVRLPGKALLDICGIPMVIHTYKRSLLSEVVDEVYICTDSKEIAKVCKQYGASYILTSSKHLNGTERIAEAANSFSGVDYFVDIQGDEPLINPKHIDKVVRYHINNNCDIVLPHIITKKPINENIVKVVESGGRVLYLTRANCPYPFRSESQIKKHLSVISFTPEALNLYAKMPESPLEKIESVELLRAIEGGLTIGTFKLSGDSFSVDVGQDYVNAMNAMKDDGLFKKYSPNG
jgi:3-deoxy-manno-octulosonate cytidylyltransferase (CMP-KDO synthetase)